MEPVAIAACCASLHRRNYAPHTIDNYGRDLRLFFGLIAREPCTVSGRDVVPFIEPQRQAQRAATTINRRLNALQPFFD
jgi:integrase/recombinase XerD